MQAGSKDRDHVTSLWMREVIPTLMKSTIDVLKNAGDRLKAEWASKASEREAYWKDVKENELKKRNRTEWND